MSSLIGLYESHISLAQVLVEIACRSIQVLKAYSRVIFRDFENYSVKILFTYLFETYLT